MLGEGGGIDEDALRRLLQRRAAIEHGAFKNPPADWGAFMLMRGRWCEVNDLITAIEMEVAQANAYEDDK